MRSSVAFLREKKKQHLVGWHIKLKIRRDFYNVKFTHKSKDNLFKKERILIKFQTSFHLLF